MQNILAIALGAMHQDMARLDRVAANIANVATPGYKRDVVGVAPFTQALSDATMAEGTGPAMNGLQASPLMIRSDDRPGSLKNTGEALDLALTGEGYFEVATAEGPAYTRQGNFKVDPRGRLVTARGDAVLGKAGEIHLATTTPLIDAAGNITEPNATPGGSAATSSAPVAQLKVVRFDGKQSLQRLGEGLLAAGSGMTVMTDSDVRLQQGALENGNVQSMQEMVQMIQTMRHFESMQKMAQGYDDMLGTAIHKLGDLS